MNSSEHDTDFDPFATENSNKKSGKSSGNSGAGISFLALLLSLLAITYSAYDWWKGESVDPEARSRQVAMDNLRQSQEGLNQSLQSMQNRLASAEQNDDSGNISALRSDISSLQSRMSEMGLDTLADRALLEVIQITLSDMGQRIGDIETSVAALAVRSDTPGKKMDLAEVDYLLRLAGERLALFGDARSADRALELADQQLEALDDPLYLPVRRRISESRIELQGLPAPDVVAISSQIAALQSSIPSLPFPGELRSEVMVGDQADTGLWQRVKNALKPLVQVRRRVDESQELSLEDKDFLRQGLWLQLESARLALMRNDSVAWRMSLSQALEGLTGRFDGGSRPVVAAISGIEELAAMELVQEMPDVSAAWRQLRLLREGRPEPAEAAVTAPAEPVEETMEEAVEETVEPADDNGEPAV